MNPQQLYQRISTLEESNRQLLALVADQEAVIKRLEAEQLEVQTSRRDPRKPPPISETAVVRRLKIENAGLTASRNKFEELWHREANTARRLAERLREYETRFGLLPVQAEPTTEAQHAN